MGGKDDGGGGADGCDCVLSCALRSTSGATSGEGAASSDNDRGKEASSGDDGGEEASGGNSVVGGNDGGGGASPWLPVKSEVNSLTSRRRLRGEVGHFFEGRQQMQSSKVS